MPLDSKIVETSIFQHSPPTRFGKKYREKVKLRKNLEVYLNANVTNIQIDKVGQNVEYLDVATLGGDKFTVSAGYYIIAMGGIENARILMLSNNVLPTGIGNQYDVVGRYFMDHPVAKGAIFVSVENYSRSFGPVPPHENVSAAFQLSRTELEREQLLNLKAPMDPVGASLAWQ